MAKVRPSDVLFWILATLTLAFLVFFLLVLSGGVPIESPGEASEAAQTTETTAAEPVAAKPKAKAKTKAATPAQKPAQLATVVLTAARGDCWIQARAGSEEGRVLDERVLSQGESISLKGKSIWLAVGAAGNLDVTVNGKPQPLSPGTVSVVLSAKGSTTS